MTPDSHRNAEPGEYQLHLTNVPPDGPTPEDVARTHAARWEVELLFKELRSGYGMHDLPSTQPHIVEALSILPLLANRSLLAELRRSTGLLASRTPERRWRPGGALPSFAAPSHSSEDPLPGFQVGFFTFRNPGGQRPNLGGGEAQIR